MFSKKECTGKLGRVTYFNYCFRNEKEKSDVLLVKRENLITGRDVWSLACLSLLVRDEHHRPGKPQQILLLRSVLIVSLLVAVVHSQSLTVLTTYYATTSKYIGLPLVF